jgi:rubrerythrin
MRWSVDHDHVFTHHPREPPMPSTRENLLEAFSGESQAHRKYLVFAEQAEKDGLPNIARLFCNVAEAESVHAVAHLAALDGVGSTIDNLKAAVAGETHEYKTMYPRMLKTAEAEGHKAKRMFGYAVKAEEVHAKLCQMALEAATQGKDLDVEQFYLCPICGHIEPRAIPEKCPICGAKREKFLRVRGAGDRV